MADVLFFGTYDETTHPRVRGLREGLVAAGLDVAVCNAPLGVDTAARVDLVRHPARLIGFVATLVARWGVLTGRRLSWLLPGRRRRGPDVVIVGYLGHLDVFLARVLFPRATLVLDLLVGLRDTARDRDLVVEGGLRGLVGRCMSGLDSAAQRVADVVVFDTEEHRRHLARPGADPASTVVVAVGAPEEYFVDGADSDPDLLRVLFYGLFTPLQGAPTIGAAMARLADDPRIAFSMVGDGQDRDATRAAAGAANATWVDWTPAEELPVLIASHQVCLGIFGTSDKARRVVPNKVFQGAAAGAVVITSDTPCQREVLGEAARYVAPGDDEALASVVRGLAGDPAEVTRLRAASRALASSRFRPAATVAPLIERLWPERSGGR